MCKVYGITMYLKLIQGLKRLCTIYKEIYFPTLASPLDCCKKKIQNHVHFVNKTLAVAPYLAAVDVLVQNSQVSSDIYSAKLIMKQNVCFTLFFGKMKVAI